jgi:hypothetical protein
MSTFKEQRCFWCGFNGHPDDLHGCTKHMRTLLDNHILYLLAPKWFVLVPYALSQWLSGCLDALHDVKCDSLRHRHYINGYSRGVDLKEHPLFEQWRNKD